MDTSIKFVDNFFNCGLQINLIYVFVYLTALNIIPSNLDFIGFHWSTFLVIKHNNIISIPPPSFSTPFLR